MCYIRLENCEPFRNFINQPAFVDTRHHTLRLGERTEEFFASWFVPADWCTFIWQQCRIDFLLKFAASSKWLTYTRTECQGPKTKGHYQWQSEFPTFHLLPCCCRRSHRIGASTPQKRLCDKESASPETPWRSRTCPWWSRTWNRCNLGATSA